MILKYISSTRGEEKEEITINQKILKKLKISIIIPLFNEEKSIISVLTKIPNHFIYEIIIVNDGSTDNSIEKIKQLKDGRIRLINHNENEGYGSAILSGIKKANGQIIVTLDSDGQHDPKEIPKLITPLLLNKADLVLGSRYLGECSYKVALHTRIGEFIIEKFLKLFFQQSVRNNQSGFRAFKKEHLSLFNKIHFTGFGFCTEILLNAALKNLKIKEVPITMKRRKSGNSYVKLAKISITI
jgi:glycosyltransferase involved in cell wall biosynthesis